jgi:hypothetical protein
VTDLGVPIEPAAGVRFKIGEIEFADAEACHLWAEAWRAGICTEPDRPILEAAAIYALCEAFERAPLYAE